jgi:hypothetical protein
MLTLWAIVLPIAVVGIAVGIWLLLRDTGAPASPGRHRQLRCDPPDPIRRDDEPPPDQP